MRLLKSYGILTVLFAAVLMSACENENPCPGVNLEVDIDSANQSVNIKAEGLEGLAFDLFVNDSLVQSFTGEIDTTEFSFTFETGEYKVCLIAESENCNQRIEGCVEFEIQNPNREKCLGLEFKSEQLEHDYFKFIAEFEGIETIPYVWVIDGDVVKEEPLSDNRTNYLKWDFAPGTYTVCIVSENDQCGEVSYCEEIVIDAICVEEVRFEVEEDNRFTYYFFADFDYKEYTKYHWYIDEDLVESEVPGNEATDHKLFWQFGVGTHNICLVTDQEGCESVEYCKTIEISDVDCLELGYSAVLTETDSTDFYTFTADFEKRDDVTYIWKVFVNDDFQHQEVRQAGSDADHTFVWHFDPEVEYEICLKQDECDDNQVCKNFSVD
ncbi:MAG: hypothetical protein ABJG47_13810 [Ekhidna sp.]